MPRDSAPRSAALILLSLLCLAASAEAQNYPSPVQGNQFGAPPAPGYGAPPTGGPGFGAPPQPPGFGAPQNPGFGAGPPPGGQPNRPNLADELTDFHVPPQSTLQQNVGSETPTLIPGGHVITTNEVKQTLNTNVVLVDVWNSGQPHPTLPGALWLPGAGDPGSFNDQTQQTLWQALSQASHGRADTPLVFFCIGSRCWESYNAGLRALNMGFKMVLWYRGGLSDWQAAGLPLAPANGGGAPGGIGGGMPNGMPGMPGGMPGGMPNAMPGGMPGMPAQAMPPPGGYPH